MSDAKHEELARMERCLASIDDNLATIGARLRAYQQEVQESHDHMWEARREMDHIDKVAMRQSIDQRMRSSDVLRAQGEKLRKLRRSPYFGRFDFAREDGAGTQPFYVGVHDFRDEETGEAHVYDWRAPVSSLFYDFETGQPSIGRPPARSGGS